MAALAPLSLALGLVALALATYGLVAAGTTAVLAVALIGGILAMFTGELGWRATGNKLGRAGAVLGVIAAFLAAFQLG